MWLFLRFSGTLSRTARENQVALASLSLTMRRRKPVTAESSEDDEDVNSPRGAPPGGSFSSASAPHNSVAVAESRLRKVIVRSVVGFFMVTSFVGIVWAGHLYLSALVVLIQVGPSTRCLDCTQKYKYLSDSGNGCGTALAHLVLPTPGCVIVLYLVLAVPSSDN